MEGTKDVSVCEHLLTSADIGGKIRYVSTSCAADARPRLAQRSSNRCVPPSEYAHSASLPRFRPALSLATCAGGNYPYLSYQHREDAAGGQAVTSVILPTALVGYTVAWQI